MIENSVAKRYALALIKAAKDEKEFKIIKGELGEFHNLMTVNHEFKAGMETLLFSKNQKFDILAAVNKKIGFQKKTYNFLITLVEENRMAFLEGIIQMMEDLWFEKHGIEKLKVYSAIALSQQLETKLLANLEKSFGKKIIIEKKVDPSLIAGIKIQRGLIFYDFSIEGNLLKLKEAILSDTSLGEP